jgi:alpha-glucosidase (family GH31 glycosyl hydrolase)
MRMRRQRRGAGKQQSQHRQRRRQLQNACTAAAQQCWPVGRRQRDARVGLQLFTPRHLHPPPLINHARFLFKDQYIEFTTNIAADSDLYGIGEVTLPTGLLLPRDGRVITLWARDFPAAFPDINLYGSHPFYLQVDKGVRVCVCVCVCACVCVWLLVCVARVWLVCVSAFGVRQSQLRRHRHARGLAVCWRATGARSTAAVAPGRQDADARWCAPAAPVYDCMSRADGSSHGVLLLNSNGMDIELNPSTITYRVIGGLVDLYFFMGPSPEAVIRQYHDVIGAPAMPPYWALGAHQSRCVLRAAAGCCSARDPQTHTQACTMPARAQPAPSSPADRNLHTHTHTHTHTAPNAHACARRWGYRDVSTLREVVANYSAAGLPLETIWSDIEYMPKRFWTMAMDERERVPVCMCMCKADVCARASGLEHAHGCVSVLLC